MILSINWIYVLVFWCWLNNFLEKKFKSEQSLSFFILRDLIERKSSNLSYKSAEKKAAQRKDIFTSGTGYLNQTCLIMFDILIIVFL